MQEELFLRKQQAKRDEVIRNH